MKVTSLQGNEQEKLKAQDEHCFLDLFSESDFEDLTLVVSQICNTPASLVSIVDIKRHRCKSSKGVNAGAAIPDDFPFSADRMVAGEILIISDLSKDKRFKDHLYVTEAPHAVFYAGVPLVAGDGMVLGTLCILGTVAGKLNKQQIVALQAVARQLISRLELLGKAEKLKLKQAELKMAYGDLEKIAHISSHDLKSPLNNIISLTHLLKEDYGTKFDEEGTEYINYLNDAAYQLSDMVSGILSYSRSSQILVENREDISLPALIKEVICQLNIPPNATVSYSKEDINIHTSRGALKQIIIHLLHNAINYNDSEQIKVEIIFKEKGNAYIFEVKDNGPGIADEDKEKIFELFERLHREIKDGESMGIGLAIVKRLVEKLGGAIKVVSRTSRGSAFIFDIPK